MKFDHEVKAFKGHSHTDRSLSFGMERGKVNKASGNFSYDYAGASGKLSFGDTNKGLSLQGSASSVSVLHMSELGQWAYKWLPIIFGCHCRPDRSFFFHGKKFPICARCTGELIGIVGGAIIFSFVKLTVFQYVILLLPLIIDGFAQLLLPYTSTNFRRCLTGILFGYALVSLFLMSVGYVFNIGYNYGLQLRY